MLVPGEPVAGRVGVRQLVDEAQTAAITSYPAMPAAGLSSSASTWACSVGRLKDSGCGVVRDVAGGRLGREPLPQVALGEPGALRKLGGWSRARPRRVAARVRGGRRGRPAWRCTRRRGRRRPCGELLDRGEIDRVRGRLDGGGHAVSFPARHPVGAAVRSALRTHLSAAMSARSHAAPGMTARDSRIGQNRYMTHERRATPYDATSLGTVLTIWAHPDDETYLAGGLLAASARRRSPRGRV